MMASRTEPRRLGRARRDEGAALVEFAIILPVLMALILGMITGGMALSKKINVTDAVREGARFGATIEIPGFPESSAGLPDWENKVKLRVSELSGGDLPIGSVCAALVLSTGANTACGVDDPSDSAGQYVVKVSGSGSYRLNAFFFSRNLALESGSAARYERAGT
jgi:hypothetical protein